MYLCCENTPSLTTWPRDLVTLYHHQLPPFVRRIKTLLDEERELKENVAYLQEVSGLFQDAVNGTDNPSILIGSTCNTFVNWATVSSVQHLEARMEQISSQLQDECNAD